MKRRSVLILAIGLLGFGVLLGGWGLVSKTMNREWPHQQMKNAAALGRALVKHQKIHGSYPATLEDLVGEGTLDRDTFDELQFREGWRADPEPWLYIKPDQRSHAAIIAPRVIYRDGHSGYTVVARADGSAELVTGSKIERLEEQLRQEMAERDRPWPTQ